MIRLYITFSKTFENKLNTEIGLYLVMREGSPDLKIGTTLANLSSEGNIPSDMEEFTK